MATLRKYRPGEPHLGEVVVRYRVAGGGETYWFTRRYYDPVDCAYCARGVCVQKVFDPHPDRPDYEGLVIVHNDPQADLE